jgi:hypothetical protein
MKRAGGYTGHSADVRMHLLLDGRTLSVGQLGPDFLILDTPMDHPPANGRLFFAVDGNEREWEIHLPNGISAASRRVVIAKAG